MAQVLYLLGSAAPPVLDVGRAVRAATERGWEVCVGLTPTAASWFGDRLPELAELTGRPVRVGHRTPGAADDWPPATVAAVVPATLNTVNTIALGLTPSWVAAYACEAIGKRWPLLVMPCVNAAYATHPQFGRSVATLRDAGVRVLLGAPDGFVPLPPGQASPDAYPWHLALRAAGV
ncbi:flavoprotein [Streptomyces sp. PT12]|uniref:flavoprotein n=1 Tax=Streptomyces sp. PT12 TaxID=1510197 RepID=UPI000DE2F921|nr:flavoprotein [Streptomyces sp. PT12]RBM07228.1 flavoprotein [Streptomyces sp. PT12]